MSHHMSRPGGPSSKDKTLLQGALRTLKWENNNEQRKTSPRKCWWSSSKTPTTFQKSKTNIARNFRQIFLKRVRLSTSEYGSTGLPLHQPAQLWGHFYSEMLQVYSPHSYCPTSTVRRINISIRARYLFWFPQHTNFTSL